MVVTPVDEEAARWMLELRTERRHDRETTTGTLPKMESTDPLNAEQQMDCHSPIPNELGAAGGSHLELNAEQQMDCHSPIPNELGAAGGSHLELNANQESSSPSPKPDVLHAASGSQSELIAEQEMISHSPKPNVLDAANGSQSELYLDQDMISHSPKPNLLVAASGSLKEANRTRTKIIKTVKKYTKTRQSIRKPTSRLYINNPRRNITLTRAKVEKLEETILVLYSFVMALVSLFEKCIKQNVGEPTIKKRKSNAEQTSNNSPVLSADSGISLETTANESTLMSSFSRQLTPNQILGPLNGNDSRCRANLVNATPAQIKKLVDNAKIFHKGFMELLSIFSNDKRTKQKLYNPNDTENFSSDGEEPKTSRNDDDLVPIGKGYAKVPARVLKTINWESYTCATRKLLQAIFPRSVLATHCLTGKASPAFSDRPAKKILDPKLVDDIIITVIKKCNVPVKLVRNCITIKCSDEAKLYRARQKKLEERKSQNENGENISPPTILMLLVLPRTLLNNGARHFHNDGIIVWPPHHVPWRPQRYRRHYRSGVALTTS